MKFCFHLTRRPSAYCEGELSAGEHLRIQEHQANDCSGALADVEDFLIGKRLTAVCDLKQIQSAAQLLYHPKGRFRVAELAEYCDLSTRHLQRRFHEATDVSPSPATV